MRDDDGRESWVGRAWLGCQTFLVLGVPVWVVITAVLVQSDPWQAPPIEVDGDVVVTYSALRIALWVVLGLVLTAPVVLAPLVIGSALARVAARRERAIRRRYDQMVRDAAVIHDDRWVPPEPGAR